MTSLESIPSTGFVVLPGYAALSQESFTIKATGKHFTRRNLTVTSKASEAGQPGAPFMEIDQGTDRRFSFIDAKTGKVVFTIKREKRVYQAWDHAGAMLWQLEHSSHCFRPDEYTLTLHRPENVVLNLQKKSQGREMELVWNSLPVLSLDKSSAFSWRREDYVQVAEGMDTTLGIGLAFCRNDIDKEREKARRRRMAVGAAVSAGH